MNRSSQAPFITPAVTRYASRVSPIACLLAVGSVFLAGCDSRDDQAATAVKSASAYLAAGDAVAAAEAVSSVSPSTDGSLAGIQAAATLGDAKLALGNSLSAKLSAQLLDADRLVSEMQQLIGVIEVGAKLVDGYQKYDVNPAKQQITTFITQAQGKDTVPAWMGEGTDPSPTIATARARISQLQAGIAGNQEKIESLIGRRDTALREAGQLLEASSKATGRESVSLYAQASAARKRASDLSTEVEILEAALIPLNDQLAIEQGRLAIVEKYATDQLARIKMLEDGAAARLAKVDGQREVSRQAITRDGDAAAGVASISSKAAELLTVLNEAAATKEEVITAFSAASDAFGKAQAGAEQLARLKARADEIRAADPASAKAIDAQLNAFSVAIYRSAKGKAELAAATRHAAYVSTLTGLQRTLARLTPAAAAAGAALPATIAQLQADLDTRLATATELANTAFDSAAELTAVVTAGNDPRRTPFKISNIVALYTHSAFLRETGKTELADSKWKDAIALRDELVNDGITSFPGLPTELVPPPKPPEPAAAPEAPAAPAEAAPAEPAPAPAPAEPAPAPPGR